MLSSNYLYCIHPYRKALIWTKNNIQEGETIGTHVNHLFTKSNEVLKKYGFDMTEEDFIDFVKLCYIK